MFRNSKIAALVIAASSIFVAAGPVDAQHPATESDEIGSFVGSIEQLDPSMADLIDGAAKIEVLSNGHQWTEGPVWNPAANQLLFSDVPRNKIHGWSPASGNSVFMQPSGYDGDNGESEPGSNGLFLDREGRLLVCDHGNRRVYRVEADGSKTKLIDRFEGKRFNSPNDLVVRSNGEIYFTDPPYGLKDKSKRELDFCGVYRLSLDGTVTLITKELLFPNGIGLSPDGNTLYVAQSHRPAPVYMAYAIADDGSINAAGKLLFDASKFAEAGDPGMPDGMTVDVNGNLWATGPGGVLIISPAGKLLGRILMGKPTANCAFGGPDGSTLFITSSDRVCKVQTKTKGHFPTPTKPTE